MSRIYGKHKKARHRPRKGPGRVIEQNAGERGRTGQLKKQEPADALVQVWRTGNIC